MARLMYQPATRAMEMLAARTNQEVTIRWKASFTKSASSCGGWDRHWLVEGSSKKPRARRLAEGSDRALGVGEEQARRLSRLPAPSPIGAHDQTG
jgi:hypothetical protein